GDDMQRLVALAGLAGSLMCGLPAHAQAAPETLQIGKTKGGGMSDESAGAGGYGLIAHTYSLGKASGDRTEARSCNVDVRVQKDSAAPKAPPEQLLKGKCTTTGTIAQALWSGLLGTHGQTTSLSKAYGCKFDGV